MKPKMSPVQAGYTDVLVVTSGSKFYGLGVLDRGGARDSAGYSAMTVGVNRSSLNRAHCQKGNKSNLAESSHSEVWKTSGKRRLVEVMER